MSVFNKIFQRRSREVIVNGKTVNPPPFDLDGNDLSTLSNISGSDDESASEGLAGNFDSEPRAEAPPTKPIASATAAATAAATPKSKGNSSHNNAPGAVVPSVAGPVLGLSSPGTSSLLLVPGEAAAGKKPLKKSGSNSKTATSPPSPAKSSSQTTPAEPLARTTSNTTSKSGRSSPAGKSGSGSGSGSGSPNLARRHSDGARLSSEFESDTLSSNGSSSGNGSLSGVPGASPNKTRHKRHASMDVLVSASTAERAAEVKSALQRKYQSIRASNGRYNPLERRRTLQLFLQNDGEGDEDNVNVHKTIPMLRPGGSERPDVEDQDNTNKWGWLTSRGFIRLYQRNLGFKTLACDLFTTTKEICLLATDKFNLGTSRDKYHIYVQLHDCAAERRLEDDEQPLLLQQQWLRDMGYDDDDALQQQGRYDHSHMFRFLFSNTSTAMEHSWEHMERKFEAFVLGIGVSNTHVKSMSKLRPSLLLQYTDELDLSNHSLGTLLHQETTTLSSLLLNSIIQSSLGKLSLSGNVLPFVPKEICSLHHLTALDLSNNILADLPVELPRLTRLEVLNLSQNAFSTLPLVIGGLQRLRVLLLADNRIHTIPTELSQLQSLEKLDLRGNSLVSLDPSLMAMPSLKWLNITNNKIDALPQAPADKPCVIQHLLCDSNMMSIARIFYPNLHEVTLRQNNITVFAPPGASLACLSKLDLSANKLISLPDSIDRLASLRFLLLDNNRLTRLPNTLTKLSNLETLSVTRNALTSLPDMISNLRRLKHLLIQVNNLTHLPEELWFLPQLVLLNAGSNLLQYLPDLEIYAAHQRAASSGSSASFSASTAAPSIPSNAATAGGDAGQDATRQSTASLASNSTKPSDGTAGGGDSPQSSGTTTPQQQSGGEPVPAVTVTIPQSTSAPSLSTPSSTTVPPAWDASNPMSLQLRMAMLMKLVNEKSDSPVALLPTPCTVVGNCPTSPRHEGHVRLRSMRSLPPVTEGENFRMSMLRGSSSSSGGQFGTVVRRTSMGSINSRYSTISSVAFPPEGGAPPGAFPSYVDENATDARKSGIFGTKSRKELRDQQKALERERKEREKRDKVDKKGQRKGRPTLDVAGAGGSGGTLRADGSGLPIDELDEAAEQQQQLDDIYSDDDTWPRLRELYLGDNKLGDDCLEIISKLKNLRVLHLGNNALMEIEGLGKLRKLRTLCLSGNDIAYISEDIENIKYLHALFISNNKLSNLPTELSKLKYLWTVDARDNNLRWNLRNEEFDWNWTSNPELRHLDISGNKRFIINDPNVDFFGMVKLNLLGLEGVQVYNDFPEILRPALRMVKEPDTKVGARFARFDFRSGLAEMRPGLYQAMRPRAASVSNSLASIFTPPAGPTGAHAGTVRSSSAGQAGATPNRRSHSNSSSSSNGNGKSGAHSSVRHHSAASPGAITLQEFFAGDVSSAGGHPERHSGAGTEPCTEFLRIDRYRNRPRLALFGLFDGHRGSEVSRFVRENFLAVFEEEMGKCNQDAIRGLRRAFLSLNRKLGVLRLGKLCGSSGLVVFLDKDKLYAANLGDSMAVLCRSGKAKLLSVKHAATTMDERERIKSVGGAVSDDARVFGAVDASRAFGDFFWAPSVNCNPHTTTEPLTQEDEFVILACCGLWDVMTPQMAVDIAKSEPTPSKAAQKLRDFAWLYGARDSITVMVVFTPSSARLRKNRDGKSALQQRGFDGVPTSVADLIKAPVGKVTLVFTDITNSLVLWELYENAMRQAVKDHNDLLRKLLRLHRGYEVKTEGEAFMVAFDNPMNALRWCLEVQLQLLEVPWPEDLLATDDCKEIRIAPSKRAPISAAAARMTETSSPVLGRKSVAFFDSVSGSTSSSPVHGGQNGDAAPVERVIWRGLRVRMGIHTGNPDCEPDPVTGRMDYFGPTVNRSARVTAVADGGQIVVSSSAWEELEGDMPHFEDTAVANLGSFELKGMEKKETIKQILPARLVDRSPFFMHPPRPAEPVAVAASSPHRLHSTPSFSSATQLSHSPQK
ncbi:leucine-rich repeat-containing protein 69 [Capsaspora owczarzaki ATCC 30864]|uniref:Adenylate cyclase n=1 Tax=Capsaspora owczarzaki (strain ATCC 30864) TaxID=595528 RepID=A0A0D2WLY6_CAPO3|nr:leucine-rich repeat-containing protein 69 [Capsaspora owczarzaki ATCC 30864]KJE91038.1 leucine-rich repeat-containing protein 69 [Capsaspora owczarzaki ATCC 30864]|eukprot:XP_004348989.1 leucine-rich repeat-containing protein 69 [Capsaspora owczarzaki ATCC 30864]